METFADPADPTGPFRQEVANRLLSVYESHVFDQLERERQAGLELDAWFQEAWKPGSEGLECFDLLPTHRGHSITGFRAEPDLPSLGPTPVFGAIQDIPFDRPKTLPDQVALAADWIRGQARAFMLDQFLRITAFERSQPYPQLGSPSLPALLELFSWCPARGVVPSGIRFDTRLFQRLDGEYGRFPQEMIPCIPSLETFGEHYRWLWLEAETFDRYLTLRFAGSGGPALQLPIRQPLSLLLVPELVVDEEDPEAGVSTFGFGLVLLGGRPRTWHLATPALYRISLLVNGLGQVVARTLFLSRKPNYPAEIPGFDPTQSTIWLSDFLGPTSQAPKFPREVLDRSFLLSRSLYLYYLVLQMLPTWNWIPDWCDVSDRELLHCLDSSLPPERAPR